MESYAHPARSAPVLALLRRRGLEIPGTRATLPHGCSFFLPPSSPSLPLCPLFSTFTSPRLFTEEDRGIWYALALRRLPRFSRVDTFFHVFPPRTVEDAAGARGSALQEIKDTSQMKSQHHPMVCRLGTLVSCTTTQIPNPDSHSFLKENIL
ncbi:hypothetical protein C8R45DRAFT_1221612, partial [Mycena sanguinolenta]